MAYKRKTITDKEFKSLLKPGGTKIVTYNNSLETKETITIEGYSIGDASVGIGPISFFIDTGLYELTNSEKEYIVKNIIRDIWELHDNGDLVFNFSDDIENDRRDYPMCYRKFTWKDSEKILSEVK